MNHENKLQVLANIASATHANTVKSPWMIVCQILAAHEWQDAVAESAQFIPADLPVSYRGLQQLELWLEAGHAPHVIIVDEYDPGLRQILTGLFPAMVAGGHRLFMARPHDMDQPKPQLVNDTLDFMTP